MNRRIALDPARLWRSHQQEVLLIGAFAIAGIAATTGAAFTPPTSAAVPVSPVQAAIDAPAAPPLLVRDIPTDDAIAINREIPVFAGANPAAAPFSLGKADSAARARALECLTSAVYYEAGSEDTDGQKAVAQVVLNRVRHPAFPASVCGVVYQGSTRATGCQFTFTCDGSLLRQPSALGWKRASIVAQAALAGAVYRPVGNATHYHADYVVPYWAASLTKNAVQGAHIFYRWNGSWGGPRAFVQKYAQTEPDSRQLRIAAVSATHTSGPVNSEAELKLAEQVKDAAIMDAILASGKSTDNRVALRFNPAARKAVEEAPREPYVEKVQASDNLRWTLTGESQAAPAAPFGKDKPEAASPAVSAGAPN